MDMGGAVVARLAFKAGDEFAMKLSQLAAKADEVAIKAVRRGAGILTDEVRARLAALPEDFQINSDAPYRYLRDGEKFSGVPPKQKEDLLEALGVTPVETDKNGDYNAKVGFDGYGSQPTKTYPKGIPNQLIARAIESGSSVREKRPFVKPAVQRVKKKAVEAMHEVIDKEYEKVMK